MARGRNEFSVAVFELKHSAAISRSVACRFNRFKSVAAQAGPQVDSDD